MTIRTQMQRETQPQETYSTTVDPTKEVLSFFTASPKCSIATVGMITFFDWLCILGGLL